MKKIILLFVLPIIIGISNVSADETSTGTNTSPVAVQDTATTSEDTSVEIDLTSNDTDAEDDTLSITWVSDMLNWTWQITSSWTWVIFTPTENFNWTWSFIYTVSDSELTDTWSVVITVTPVNDAPVANPDTASTDQDTEVEVDVVSNDTDVDWDTLTVTWVDDVLNWEVEINSSWTWIVFTPDSWFKWMVRVEYTVSDGELEDEWVLLISVEEENFPPVAIDDTLITDENTSETIDPRENDTDWDDDELHITWATEPTHWTVTFTSISVTYTPDEDYYGNDRFEYTVDDWNGWTDIWVVRVTVKREDDDDDDDDNWNKFKEKYVVKAVQKEFISKFKKLKSQYKYSMKYKDYRDEYLRLKKELRAEYLGKLKEVTGPAKKYSYSWDTVKTKYYIVYKNKYWKSISKLSDSKLEIVVERIDDRIAQINAWNYSDDKKEKYNTMLLALRELVVSYMEDDEDVLDIDSIFE